MKWALCVVAAAALLLLGLRASRVGLAGDWIDPVGRVSAQDEALYSHSAIRMAEQGGWLTPMFLGRYGLYKPPLLMWMSGASARLLGVSRISLRLPVVFAGALSVCLVFLWVLDHRGWLAAAGAALLLLSNHLWVVLGGMALTDGLLASAIVGALYILHRDPALRGRASAAGLGLAAGAAVLAKSIAGATPFAVLAVYWMLAPVKCRPPLRRAAAAVFLAFLVAAPWFVYQAAVHPRWFWAEHVGLELVAFGTRTPPQTSQENQLWFYAVRQWLLDPALFLLALAALPAWIGAVRRRSPSAILLLAWLGTLAVSILLWRYRNVSYLLPVIPALAILGAAYGPVFHGRNARWALAALSLVFAIKAAAPDRPWGLSFAAGTRVPEAPLLSGYCERGRASELVVFGVEDGFYATVLPLPRVRYALMGAPPAPGEYALDFASLGIILTASQYAQAPAWEKRSLPRLREWGLDSPDPVGTLILAGSRGDLLDMVRSHPETDFFLPRAQAAWLAPLVAATHASVAVSEDRWLLLSRRGADGVRVPSRGACRL